jgi:hypothetical protein
MWHALRSKRLPPRLLPQIRFPGAYRCVCVELRITHLAVNAILEVGGWVGGCCARRRSTLLAVNYMHRRCDATGRLALARGTHQF